MIQLSRGAIKAAAKHMAQADLIWAGRFTIEELVTMAQEYKIETEGTKLKDLANQIATTMNQEIQK